MDILVVLKREESKLQQQLKAIQAAIAALIDSHRVSYHAPLANDNRPSRKRPMSAEAKEKISKASKARWARHRANKAKKAK
jgi:hypothetical protein